MESHIDEEFEGTLVDIDKDSVIIKLDNNIRGVIAYTDEFSQAFYVDTFKKELKCNFSKTKAKLGTRLSIKVHDVNIPQKEIYFDIVEIHKNPTLTRKKEEN